MDGREIARRIELLAGVGLVAFGGLFALAELAGGGRAWELIWPLFVVVPGLLVFAGTFSFGRGGSFLAIPGSILTVGGLLLLYTNTLGVWVTWSYLWPLLTPGAVGLGLLVFGVRISSAGLRATGAWLLCGGIALFVVLGAVLQALFGIPGPFGPGTPFGRVFWPVALIALGVWLIVMWSRKR